MTSACATRSASATGRRAARGPRPRAPGPAQRIAFFLPDLGGGGTESVMARLASDIAERGHPVDFLLARAEGPFLARLSAGVRRIGFDARVVAAALPGLVRHLQRSRPDVLVSALPHANLLAAAAGMLSGRPPRLFLREENHPSIARRRTPGLSSRAGYLLCPVVYRLANRVIAVSQGVADDLVNSTGVPRGLVRVIYNPVLGPEVAARAAEPAGHPWFADGGPPIVLGCGRLTEQKAFPLLIAAVARVRARRRVRLLILGDGPLRPGLEAAATAAGLGGDAAFPGFLANPYACMARCAVFVLSSAWEGLGNVLIEAMACGAPVVATDCPSGPAEILAGGALGALVPNGDVAAVAAGIERALDGGIPRDTPAHRRHLQRFTARASVDAHLRTFLAVR